LKNDIYSDKLIDKFLFLNSSSSPEVKKGNLLLKPGFDKKGTPIAVLSFIAKLLFSEILLSKPTIGGKKVLLYFCKGNNSVNNNKLYFFQILLFLLYIIQKNHGIFQ